MNKLQRNSVFIPLFFLLTFFSTICWGQQEISGKISNTKNSPIEGAYIYSYKNSNHVHSDFNGEFHISNINKNDTLRISHLGYESYFFHYNGNDTFYNIKLTKQAVNLDEIVVSPNLNALNVFTDLNILTNPVNNSQEILRSVPGIVIGQHAGGGKAEQIFLRGFDIDHGTDISINVDGMPVNMVSHAHGQGYADLHFIIPETIRKLDFGKGPYEAEYGNFTTAGFVDFQLKEQLDESEVSLEVGQFSTQRLLGAFDLLDKNNHHAYLASEVLLTDGPYESPQNFHRINVMGRYSGQVGKKGKLSLTAMHFTSKWDASGQIPIRKVLDGTINRFGAIDNTEGGKTRRSSVIVNYLKTKGANSFLTNTPYLSKYDFELFSNFTFFLNDSVNGDQIKQQEDRFLFGSKTVYNQSFHLNKVNGFYQAGLGLRSDVSKNNELSRTLNRSQTLSTIQLGDVYETNIFGFLNSSFTFGKLTLNPSVRFDYFQFNYNDHLQSEYSTQSINKTFISPKFNVLFNVSQDLQLYLKTGRGFHSNDSRVVLGNTTKSILPSAYGSDLGVIWKPIPKIVLNTAFWYLFLEQEFVYVGDEGVVEPSGKTQRLGLDFSLRYQPLQWLFGDIDVNYAHARAIDEAEGEDFIPLAPDLTVTSAINIIHPKGFHGGIQIRYLKDRPANEDNSIVAEGYAIVDMNLGYQWKKLEFGVSVQNLFNSKWNETQFATESRLQDESESVEEIHFTPGTPFFIKGKIGFKF